VTVGECQGAEVSGLRVKKLHSRAGGFAARLSVSIKSFTGSTFNGVVVEDAVNVGEPAGG
jgi:hypothetical protein